MIQELKLEKLNMNRCIPRSRKHPILKQYNYTAECISFYLIIYCFNWTLACVWGEKSKLWTHNNSHLLFQWLLSVFCYSSSHNTDCMQYIIFLVSLISVGVCYLYTLLCFLYVMNTWVRGNLKHIVSVTHYETTKLQKWQRRKLNQIDQKVIRSRDCVI